MEAFGEITGDWLEAMIDRCSLELADHPASRYLVRSVCAGMLREYEGHGVSWSTGARHEQMHEPIENALARPDDIGVLNELVRAAMRIGLA